VPDQSVNSSRTVGGTADPIEFTIEYPRALEESGGSNLDIVAPLALIRNSRRFIMGVPRLSCSMAKSQHSDARSNVGAAVHLHTPLE
jgi:hypothetical protein